MSEQTTIVGKLIDGVAIRDAIHVAVAPCVSSEVIYPAQSVEIVDAAECSTVRPAKDGTPLGIADPFLDARIIYPGQKFWVFLTPNTITGLKHVWTHPAFVTQPTIAAPPPDTKSDSIKWMEGWAKEHMEGDYSFAIQAGDRMSVGGFESARDHIDGEWWKHWERITGKTGSRDEYFSCAC